MMLMLTRRAQDFTRSIAPVLLDYSDNGSSQQLSVSFVKSQFLVSPNELGFTYVHTTPRLTEKVFFPFSEQ